MFKKITTLLLATIIFTTASSVSVLGQTKLTDENQTVSQNIEPKNEKLREAFFKKDNSQPVAVIYEKETMASYQKQKKQGQNFSKGAVIAVAAGVAILVTILVIRYGVNEQ